MRNSKKSSNRCRPVGRGISCCLFAGAVVVGLITPGLAPAGTSLFVGDYTTSSVKLFDATSGAYLGEQALGGSFGPGSPMGMAFGPDGNLYVADNTNNSVDKLDGTSGAFINQFIPTTAGTLVGPSGLAFGADGNLYVANYGTGGNSFINRYDGTTGAFIDQFVAAGFGPSGGLFYPAGVTFGPNGNLFVADTSNGTIDEFDRITGAFTAFVVAGNPPSPLSAPESVAFGPDGNLYVTDAITSTIHRYNGTTGAYVDEFITGSGGLVQPIDLKFGPGGVLYVTDGQGRVAQYDATSGASMPDLIAPDGHTLVNPQFMAFSVPEPGSVALIAAGFAAFFGLARRRFR